MPNHQIHHVTRQTLKRVFLEVISIFPTQIYQDICVFVRTQVSWISLVQIILSIWVSLRNLQATPKAQCCYGLPHNLIYYCRTSEASYYMVTFLMMNHLNNFCSMVDLWLRGPIFNINLTFYNWCWNPNRVKAGANISIEEAKLENIIF